MPEVKEWLFDPKEILASNRKVKGIFHKSVIDKDDELITPDAIKKSIPDYMHLPALHDFHKERPVGLATRIWQEKDGSFGFEGVIKATEDCDDIWEKISKGNYDHVSIFGRRTEGNQNCSLPQGLRTGPCITNGVRLDSISVCDDNARNDSTSLSVKKAQLIWDGMDMIQKAETAGESGLMHTVTDYPEKKCPCSKKKYKVIEKGDDMDVEKGGWEKSMNETEALHKKTQRPEQRKLNEKKKKTAPEGLKLQKGDEEDVEKGKCETCSDSRCSTRTAGTEMCGGYKKKRGSQHKTENFGDMNTRPVSKGDEEDDEMTDDVEKGQWGEDTAEIHSHDIRHRGKTTSGTQKRTEGKESSMKETDTTATSKPAPKKEKPREKTSGVKYDKMEKADDDDEQEIDTETRGEDAKEEMDDDEDEVEEKAIQKIPLKKQPEKKKVNNTPIREVKKGDTMEEKEEVSQEYVTKAMVPIEEIDTIVKARTEEISKAYIAQFDEIKKANLAAIDEIKKAYDAKFAELNTKVDKMAEETIRKGGSIVVIPQLLDPTSQTGSMSNADALARMTVGR